MPQNVLPRMHVKCNAHTQKKHVKAWKMRRNRKNMFSRFFSDRSTDVVGSTANMCMGVRHGCKCGYGCSYVYEFKYECGYVYEFKYECVYMNLNMIIVDIRHLKLVLTPVCGFFKFPLHRRSPSTGTGLLFLHNQGHNHSNN